MTAYFDDAARTLREIKRHATEAGYDHERVVAFETNLVDDVLLAASYDDFPDDLRTLVYANVLDHGIHTVPNEYEAQVDFETYEEGFDRLRRLVERFHDLFHEVGSRDIPGIHDSPLHWRLRAIRKAREGLEVCAEERLWGPIRARAAARGWLVLSGADTALVGSGDPRPVLVAFDTTTARFGITGTGRYFNTFGEAVKILLDETEAPKAEPETEAEAGPEADRREES